jgi:hypothetical protein
VNVHLDITERSPGERLSYIQGFEAAVKFIQWRLTKAVPAEKVIAQAQAAAALARSTSDDTDHRRLRKALR